MAEDIVERFGKVMNNPMNIRNICTSAHIHHGKCISGASRMLLTNGSIRTAKEIYEEIADNGKIHEENSDHTIFIPNKPIEIFTLNKEYGKIEKRDIQYAWRIVGGNTIKVKLRNGFEISTTPEHKFIASRDLEFTDVEAKDLKIGDRIVCPRSLDNKSNMNIKIEILENLSNENFYINLNKLFYTKLKNKILSFGIKNIEKKFKLSIKQKSFYHGLWKNRINLKDLIQISKLLKIDLEELYNKIDYIFYRNGKQRGHNSLKIQLPMKFENFFYIVGLLFGDGSGKKFIVGKKELEQKFIDLCKDLGMNVKAKQWGNKTPEILTNLTFLRLLNCLFEYPLRKKAHNIRISDFLFRSKDEYVAQFLKGYFDTDGCVEESRRAITISSVSNQMVKDLHLLLLRFECLSIKEIDNTISISGLSALNFSKNIGFNVEHKVKSLNHLVERVSGGLVCDTVKVGNQVMLINSKNLAYDKLAFVEVKSLEQSHEEIVYDFTIPETHNFIAEGMIIHNTALTDNLLAAAGLMSTKSAGNLDQGMTTWQHADEQERLMTVDAANVSMIHDFNNQEFLINLIDTPGHVDFGGNVTRAMRAIDGTVVLVCASEGIMPQTETVLKQAIRERVKPILFLNKVDRLINEMKYTPEQMQKRFLDIVNEFNQLVEQIAEPEFKEKWKVSIKDGSVAFGSARENWALSLGFMEKKGINFKDILKLYDGSLNKEEIKEWVWKNAPLHEVILDMVIKHLPNPVEAQKYRISRIWKGDPESTFGQDLLTCNKKGKVAFCITRILVDPKSGREISAGRLFSGTIKAGMNVYLNNAKKAERVQQVLMYNGIRTQQMEEVVAGNVLGLMGISGEAGETITEEPEHPFEELKHIFEPVITKAIEPVKAQDLAKIIEVLKTVGKEDPSIKIQINDETGECLMSGMGELHLEIVENRMITEKGVQIKTTQPLVVYRETISKKSPEAEGKSPNKHNVFYITVEPIPENMYAALKNGDLPETRLKKKDDQVIKKLVELGYENKEALKFREFYKGNAFIDSTRGVVHIGEVIELILDGFRQVIDAGPLAREPCTKMLVTLNDTKLHEDSIHRGPAQVLPAIREAIRGAMIQAAPSILEPLQILQIESVVDNMGSVSKLVSSKRGQLLDMVQEGNYLTVKCKLPVAEMFGLSAELRSATEGRGTFFVADQLFEKLPLELQQKVILQIRTRKGLSENQ